MPLANRRAAISFLLPLVLFPAFVDGASCGFRAIFNFGDSNSDTGGFWAAFPAQHGPFGLTFFKRPAGRASDGRLVIDFLAQAIGLPFLSPYLQSIGSNFAHGANFATLASTVLMPDTSLFVSGISPFYLAVQLNQMKEFRDRVLRVSSEANLPPHDIFGQALYTLDIGQNDFTSNLAKIGISEVQHYLPQVADQIGRSVKELYDIGGRTFFVFNLAPIGCFPAFLKELPHNTSDMDEFGCMISYNNAVADYNSLLNQTLHQIQDQLNDASVVYVDTHSVKLELYRHPETYDQSLKPMGQSIALHLGGASSTSSSYGYSGSIKKIEIPNGRVGVIIGKSGETIKYLQSQSGARIQITRDVDADPNSQSRPVDLVGTPEQISKAEQLINDLLSESDAGGSSIASARKFSSATTNSEHFSMKVPNNKVGVIIGKGGENIRSMQATSGARIQVIPLHLPPGSTATERTVHIDGTKEQIELAKQLINDGINSEHRARNPQTGGFRPPMPPPPANWASPGAPQMQQATYGYMQPGAYPGPVPQYNIPQLPYGGYPPQASSAWAQPSISPAQQTAQGASYDYYSQQQQQPLPAGGSSVPLNSNNYNYGQGPIAYNGQASYTESAYSHSAAGDYNQAGSQSNYTQQSYNSASSYSNSTPTQEGSSNPSYAVQGSTQQAPPSQPQPVSTAQSGYAMLPASQSVYAGQNLQPSQAFGPAAQHGYGQPAQVYGLSSGQSYSLQPPTTPAGYAQNSQQLAPGYASGNPQAGYGTQQQSYAAAPLNQSIYTDAYAGSAYSQQQHPPYASADGTIVTTSTEPATTGGATKVSPQN